MSNHFPLTPVRMFAPTLSGSFRNGVSEKNLEHKSGTPRRKRFQKSGRVFCMKHYLRPQVNEPSLVSKFLRCEVLRPNLLRLIAHLFDQKFPDSRAEAFTISRKFKIKQKKWQFPRNRAFIWSKIRRFLKRGLGFLEKLGTALFQKTWAHHLPGQMMHTKKKVSLKKMTRKK